MITPLYPAFKKRIDDAFEELVREQVDPWGLFNSGAPFKIRAFNNKQISYEGIRFEGSPETIFWSRYVEPFIEKIVVEEIADAAVQAADKRVDGVNLINEIRGLLLAQANSTYVRMAEIDRRLKGGGFPEKIPLRSIDAEVESMKEFINLRANAEKELWHRSRFERWYKQNSFWVWGFGAVVAAVGAYAKFS